MKFPSLITPRKCVHSQYFLNSISPSLRKSVCNRIRSLAETSGATSHNNNNQLEEASQGHEFKYMTVPSPPYYWERSIGETELS